MAKPRIRVEDSDKQHGKVHGKKEEQGNVYNLLITYNPIHNFVTQR